MMIRYSRFLSRWKPCCHDPFDNGSLLHKEDYSFSIQSCMLIAGMGQRKQICMSLMRLKTITFHAVVGYSNHLVSGNLNLSN